MQRAPKPPRDIRSEMTTQRFPNTRGTSRTPVVLHTQSAKRSPTRSGSSICTAMSGLGARTAGIRTIVARLMTVRRGGQAVHLRAFYAAVLGSALQTVFAPPTASNFHRRLITTTSASELPEVSNLYAL